MHKREADTQIDLDSFSTKIKKLQDQLDELTRLRTESVGNGVNVAKASLADSEDD